MRAVKRRAAECGQLLNDNERQDISAGSGLPLLGPAMFNVLYSIFWEKNKIKRFEKTQEAKHTKKKQERLWKAHGARSTP